MRREQQAAPARGGRARLGDAGDLHAHRALRGGERNIEPNFPAPISPARVTGLPAAARRAWSIL